MSTFISTLTERMANVKQIQLMNFQLFYELTIFLVDLIT